MAIYDDTLFAGNGKTTSRSAKKKKKMSLLSPITDLTSGLRREGEGGRDGLSERSSERSRGGRVQRERSSSAHRKFIVSAHFDPRDSSDSS